MKLSRGQKRSTIALLGFVAACWMLLLADAVVPGQWAMYGVHPRSLVGLSGIPMAPFLHGNLAHLLSNTAPLLILGGILIVVDEKRFLAASFAAVLGAGVMAWLIGAPQSVHIGASGLVFGYLGFLLTRGWFSGRVGLILVSLFIAGVWGSLVFGVLPGQPGVSWQSHAGGFLGGVLASRERGSARRSRKR